MPADAASPNCTRRWLARARRRRSRRRARGRRRIDRALRQAAGDRARARRGRAAMGAIIDGRDLIDVAERALLRPLDAKAQARNRRRRQARFAGDRDQPARDARRASSSSRRSSGWSAASRRSTADGRGFSASSGSPARSARISPSPAAWRSATRCCSRSSATASPRKSRRGWAKACSTACSPPASAFPRSPCAGPRRSASQKAPGVSEVAPFLFGTDKRP